MAVQTVSEYIAAASPNARPILKKIRATVRKAVPRAEERISYRIPAYFLDGIVVYFAAFKNHIGLYPPVRDPKLKKEIGNQRSREKRKSAGDSWSAPDSRFPTPDSRFPIPVSASRLTQTSPD